MTDLLARFAECAFWMGRYMERAENLARVIDVNESFARDSRGPADWLPIVEINADTKRFFEKHDEATAEAVVAFYVRDGDNPISIVSSVRAARDNARMLRHLISTELWSHLNVFHNDLAELGPADLRLGRLSRLCMTIKEHCQTHTGIAEGTLYRDQAWVFHEIGKQLERADQTTRLLDIKYHRLLSADQAVGSSIDAGQWNALLRSAAGYHAFRRAYPRGMRPATVAGFLLFDRGFPRSVAVCVSQAAAGLGQLSTVHGLARADAVAKRVRAWRDDLAAGEIAAVIEDGLHEYLDSVQRRLIEITNDTRAGFFGYDEAGA